MVSDHQDQRKLIVDSDLNEVCNELFFLDPKMIKFWMQNEDFRSEYQRLYSGGEQDGFHLFYVAAGNVYDRMRSARDCGSDLSSDFDFKLAGKSVASMKRWIERGMDDTVLSPRLKFILHRISLPRIQMRFWMIDSDFQKKVETLIPTNTRIDDRAIYEIMKQVFTAKWISKSKLADGSFNFRDAKKSIRLLEKHLKIPEEQRFDPDSDEYNNESTSVKESDAK